MIIRIKKPKGQDIVFWISYALFLIFGILSTSFYYKYFIGTPYSMIKYFCIGLLFFRELSIGKYSIQSFLTGLMFVALVLITRSQASVSTVAFILIYIFCALTIIKTIVIELIQIENHAMSSNSTFRAQNI